MKTWRLKITAAAALSTAMLTMTGCWTPPTNLAATEGNPSLAGGIIVVETSMCKATVQSVDASSRKVVLRFEDGTTTTEIAGPEVVNFDQIQAGDRVKATVAEEYAIFLVKNCPLPSAGSGVVLAGAPKGNLPAGMIVATRDFSARVIGVDRSYRMLTLLYADGHTKTLKVPLPFTLERVVVGDNLVVRSTETMAIRLHKA